MKQRWTLRKNLSLFIFSSGNRSTGVHVSMRVDIKFVLRSRTTLRSTERPSPHSTFFYGCVSHKVGVWLLTDGLHSSVDSRMRGGLGSTFYRDGTREDMGYPCIVRSVYMKCIVTGLFSCKFYNRGSVRH